MPLHLYEALSADDPQLIGLMQRSHQKLNLRIEGKQAYFNDKQLNFDDLIRRSDYYPLSRFIFNINDILNPDRTLSIVKTCFNAYAWTQISSLKIIELACVIQGSYPIQIIIYPETESFDDAFWMINVPSRELLTCNVEPELIVEKTKYKSVQGYTRNLYAPKPIVRGPDTILSNSTVELEFEYRSWDDKFKACNFDTYIKYNAGYLPKNIISVKDGYAKAKVTALGLEPGDEITCKFSIGKIYTNAVQHTIRVV
jgi:hypothetical protein